MNNRNKANIILITVFILFIAVTILRVCTKPGLLIEFISFVLEAALVGGIADWFAVSALFTKPLGFSWHTAIIPNNRKAIVVGVSALVENELLTTESITEKLLLINPVDIILDKVSDVINSSSVEEQLSDFISEKAGALDSEKISSCIDKLIRDNLKKENITLELRDALNSSIDCGSHISWLSAAVDKAAGAAGSPETREKIFKILSEQEKYGEENSKNSIAFSLKAIMNVAKHSKYTNLRAVSGIIQSEIVKMLKQMGSKSDPVFLELCIKFEDLVRGLDNDESLTNAIQIWKNGLLDRIDLVDNLNALITSVVESQLERNEASVLIAGELQKYRQNLEHNEDMKKLADEVIRTMMGKIIINEHYLIGEVVKETLGAFTTEKLNEFIENAVGEDLQWIRINGSIVGATAGVLIFLFTNLLYKPYVIPVIRQLIGM